MTKWSQLTLTLSDCTPPDHKCNNEDLFFRHFSVIVLQFFFLFLCEKQSWALGKKMFSGFRWSNLKQNTGITTVC